MPDRRLGCSLRTSSLCHKTNDVNLIKELSVNRMVEYKPILVI